ncbi:MAG: hypothetical protein ACOYMG_11435 [Candidatus Methylumidiphilus sp.]
MPVDFFAASCIRVNGKCQLPNVACKSTVQNHTFGLCDDPPPSSLPAYIDTTDKTKWIAHVNNPSLKEVTFKAIDNCIEILRPDGTQESRCDGLLIHGNSLIFVELKDRASSGWLSKGRSQLTITIKNFKQHHDINQFDNLEAYISNKQRPLAVTNISSEVQKFKNETGMLLKANRNISI